MSDGPTYTPRHAAKGLTGPDLPAAPPELPVAPTAPEPRASGSSKWATILRRTARSGEDDPQR
jgi:hypothetical protein